MHYLRADLHVSYRMVAIRLSVAFPDLDGVGHQLSHGGLKVVVPDHAAGDAGGPRRDASLINYQDISATSSPQGLEPEGEVVRCAESMYSGSDDEVSDTVW